MLKCLITKKKEGEKERRGGEGGMKERKKNVTIN